MSQHFLVRRMRLELTRSCDHYPLKVACIPISPPAQCAQNRTRTCTSLNTRTWNERVYQFRHLGVASASDCRFFSVFNDLFRKTKQELCPAHFYRAANETRTRDPNLGKVVLYQLSYCRRMCKNIALNRKRVQRYNKNWTWPNFFEEKCIFFEKKCIFRQKMGHKLQFTTETSGKLYQNWSATPRK